MATTGQQALSGGQPPASPRETGSGPVQNVAPPPWRALVGVAYQVLLVPPARLLPPSALARAARWPATARLAHRPPSKSQMRRADMFKPPHANGLQHGRRRGTRRSALRGAQPGAARVSIGITRAIREARQPEERQQGTSRPRAGEDGPTASVWFHPAPAFRRKGPSKMNLSWLGLLNLPIARAM